MNQEPCSGLLGERHGVEELETHEESDAIEADSGQEEEVIHHSPLQVNWHAVVNLLRKLNK